MLFGPVDKDIDKYRDIERRYKESLDRWICNLYFSIRRKDTTERSYLANLMTDSNSDVIFRDFNKPMEPVKISNSPYCKF